MRKLLIASANQHKIEEIKTILSDLDVTVLSINDLESIPEEPEEDGGSFVSNARIKALAYGVGFDGWVLSDDSGIVVPILNGEPGIFSARYAGENATDVDNRKKLQTKINELGKGPLNAYFVCSLCLKKPQTDTTINFEAYWRGQVIDKDKGKEGFGYDSMFIPDNFNGTAAELSSEQKNEQSHRGLALKKFKEFFRSYE